MLLTHDLRDNKLTSLFLPNLQSSLNRTLREECYFHSQDMEAICPPTDKWIARHSTYIQIEYPSAIKMNGKYIGSNRDGSGDYHAK